MKERPILFSGEMICAILDGRKTVTRRAIKPSRLELLDAAAQAGECMPIGSDRQDWGYIADLCPYGKPGDQLWVRESWWQAGDYVQSYPEDDERIWSGSRRVVYSADGAPPNEPNRHYPNGLRKGSYSAAGPHAVWRHRPSIHMPRWASRIQLEITAVRVERLQDGEGEAAFESRYLAEGIHRIHHGDGDYYYRAFQGDPGPGNWGDPFDAWCELWQSINGPESWNANPWVWVVEFKRV